MKAYLTAFVLILIFAACQPRPMTRAAHQAPVDSALYFEPRTVTDDFFAKTDGTADTEILLHVDRIPPPPPVPEPPPFRDAEGFRVQVFAGLDSLNAAETSQAIRGVVRTDSIYIFYENGLFKVQVGDYLYRPQADEMRTTLQNTGYTGSWVIKRSILIPAVPDSSSGRYKIQIAATTSEDNAKTIVAEAGQRIQSTLFYEKSGNMYKVFVGYFNSESEAREVLGTVRRQGFADAWLVY